MAEKFAERRAKKWLAVATIKDSPLGDHVALYRSYEIGQLGIKISSAAPEHPFSIFIQTTRVDLYSFFASFGYFSFGLSRSLSNIPLTCYNEVL